MRPELMFELLLGGHYSILLLLPLLPFIYITIFS